MWTIFKVIIEFVRICFDFIDGVASRILAPQPGLEPPDWKMKS